MHGFGRVAIRQVLFVLGATLALFSVSVPAHVDAAMRISNVALSGNLIWKAARGPYHISGRVTIPPGSTLTVEKGTEVMFTGGTLLVRGSLEVMGEEGAPVRMVLDSGSGGIQFEGGKGYLNRIDASGGNQAIDAYAKSEVVVTNSKFSPGESSGGYVYLRDGSNGTFENNAFNVKDGSGYIVQAYDSIGYFSKNAFSTVSQADSGNGNEHMRVGIGLYSSWIDPVAQVDESKSVYELSGNSFSDMRHGVEAFRNVFVTLEGNTFKKNSGSGLILHSGAESVVTDNEFSSNKIGMESYNSSTTISNNAFETNIESSLSAYGGTVNAAGNWWNSSSGPYHQILNAPGTGEVVDSEPWVKIYPWIFEKPEKIVCCSSVYFMPGLQASRLYRKSFGIENQLWEPNRNGDVKKLFFARSGSVLGVYAKDIIKRSNVTNGVYEKDIYKGFVEYMDGLVRERRIKEWKPFAYDWRYSPAEIVDREKAKMVEDLKLLAKGSKTGKVAVVAHSYGGLVFRDFQEFLRQENLSHLIDKVILVGIPEHGSPKAVMSALHGEGQEIGMGFVLSKSTAREFGLSIPATFALMPDSVEFESLSTPLIRTPQGDVSNPADLEAFLARSGTYSAIPVPASSGDIDVPGKAEAHQLSFYRKGSPSPVANAGGDNGAAWRVASIVGTGIPTLTGIKYEDLCEGLLFRVKSFLSKGKTRACGLSRRPIVSTKGDGAVLPGNMDARSGKKFVFDMERYNTVHERNIAHADMISYGPVLMAILGILKDDPDERIAGGFISEYDPVPIPEHRDKPLQWITVSGDTYVLNGERFLIGNEGAVSTTTLPGKIKEEIFLGDAVLVKNDIPNMQYLSFGEMKHFISPIQTVSFEMKSRALQPVSVEVSYAPGSSTVRYSYPPLILTKDSSVHIVTSASGAVPTPTAGLQSATTTPVVIIDIDGDGSTDEVIPPEEIVIGNGSATSTVDAPQDAPRLSFKEAVALLKVEIASSTVSEPYKSRYYRKAVALERKLNGTYLTGSTEVAKAKALGYLQTNVASLTAIFSELTVLRTGKYLGTMQAADASFLYLRFYQVLKAALAELPPDGLSD